MWHEIINKVANRHQVIFGNEADAIRTRASGVRSDTIPGSRLTTPVRGWDDQQLLQQLAERQRLALHLPPSLSIPPPPVPSLKVVRARANARTALLLLTQYRLIATQGMKTSSLAHRLDATGIAEGSPS